MKTSKAQYLKRRKVNLIGPKSRTEYFCMQILPAARWIQNGGFHVNSCSVELTTIFKNQIRCKYVGGKLIYLVKLNVTIARSKFNTIKENSSIWVQVRIKSCHLPMIIKKKN